MSPRAAWRPELLTVRVTGAWGPVEGEGCPVEIDVSKDVDLNLKFQLPHGHLQAAVRDYGDPIYGCAF